MDDTGSSKEKVCSSCSFWHKLKKTIFPVFLSSVRHVGDSI